MSYISTRKGWTTVWAPSVERLGAVIPNDDSLPHTRFLGGCPCEPEKRRETYVDGTLVAILFCHNAFDGRP